MSSRNHPESLSIRPLLFVLACLVAACAPEPEAGFGANEQPDDGDETQVGTRGNGGESDWTGAAGSSETYEMAFGGAVDGYGMCTEQPVRFSRANPRVILVIDGSESMNEPFPGAASRWSALRSALLDENEGVVARLQGLVRFGMVLFSDGGENSVISDLGPDTRIVEEPCPSTMTVEPLMNNLDAIAQVFPQAPPGGWSTTAAALEMASAEILRSDLAERGDSEPAYLVLCTDGEPTACPETRDQEITDPPSDLEATKRATAEGVENGIGTYVVNLGSEPPKLQEYLDQLAEQGATGLPAFAPSTAKELTQTLLKIANSALGCSVYLNGRVAPGLQCTGELMLNGRKRECDGEHGWKLVEPRQIELSGDSCSEFNENPASILQAAFPCGVFSPD